MSPPVAFRAFCYIHCPPDALFERLGLGVDHDCIRNLYVAYMTYHKTKNKYKYEISVAQCSRSFEVLASKVKAEACAAFRAVNNLRPFPIADGAALVAPPAPHFILRDDPWIGVLAREVASSRRV